ncbi:hypothetical protein [Morganella morganii IS15]|nr:hypothetical protein CSB69_1362 [Morganella morganii]EMP50002.1 hypothetical protein C790_02674 [Morganella morganii SC01]CDK68452.1 hypothetical protein [Morganella morganii IS15]
MNSLKYRIRPGTTDTGLIRKPGGKSGPESVINTYCQIWRLRSPVH